MPSTLTCNSFRRLVFEWLLSGGDAGPTYSAGLVTDFSPASSEVNPKETGPEDLSNYTTILVLNSWTN
jgi:hypothetical protein